MSVVAHLKRQYLAYIVGGLIFGCFAEMKVFGNTLVRCGPGVGNCGDKAESAPQYYWDAQGNGVFKLHGTDVVVTYEVGSENFRIEWRGSVHFRNTAEEASEDAIEWVERLKSLGYTP